MSPPPGVHISPTSSIVLTFAGAAPADATVQAMVFHVDSSGQPTPEGMPDLKPAVIKGDTITVSPNTPISPGKYQFSMLAADPPNMMNFKSIIVVG